LENRSGAYTLLLRPLEQSLTGTSFTLKSFEAVAVPESDKSPVTALFRDWCAFAGHLAEVCPVAPARSLDAMHRLLAHGHSIALSQQLGFHRRFSAEDLAKLGFPMSLLPAA
jgi:hypothetical protein